VTALYIIGGIVLFFFLIGLIRAEVVISYADEFGLTVRVAGIPIRIIPKKPKKVKLSDYTPRALERKRKKAEKKEKKKADKAAKKAAKKEKAAKKAENDAKAGKPQKKKKMTLEDVEKIVGLITAVVKTALSRFGKHIRVRIARLHVGVATGDAAETAIMYGAISQAVCYLAHLLDSTATLRHPAKSDVNIYPDFISESPVLDIEIGISICIWQVFDLIFRSAASAIKALAKYNSQK